MNRILILFVSILVIPASARSDEDPLARYVGEAIRRNLQIEISRIDVEVAQKEMTAAAKELYPKASLSYRHSRLNRAVSINLPFLMPPGEELPDFIKAWQWQVGAQLSYPIYMGGSLRRNFELRGAAAEASARQADAVRDRLVLGVVKSYLNLKMATALERVQKQALETAEKHHDSVKAMLDQGVVTLRELKRSEAEVADAERAHIAAVNAVRLAGSSFNFLLNRDLEAEIDLSSEPAWDEEYDLQEAYENAMRRRPELEALRVNLLIGEKKVEMSRAEYLPNFSLVAEGGFRDGDIQALAGRDYWQVGIMASIKLFDSSRRHKVAAARASKVRDELRIEQMAKSIELEVTGSYLQLKNAREQMSTAERSVAASEEAHRVAELQFEQGVIDQVTYLDAELALTAARVLLEQARYSSLMAEAEFRYSAGYMIP